jgi:hypothetical protein
VQVATPVDLDESPLGRRRMVAVLGGTLEGALGSGTVLPGGADWQTIRDDGGVSIDAHYTIRLDDGTVLALRSFGVRRAEGETTYFRTAIELSGPARLSHVTGSLFVTTGHREAGSASDNSDTVHLDLYRVT